MVNCSICGREFDILIAPSAPFCSDRCRQIDLGRWLNEQYSVPYERTEDDEEADPKIDEDE